MADQYVQISPDGSGKKIDTSELTVSGNTVERQRMVIGDPTSATALANVADGDTGQNSLITAGSRKELAFSVTTATSSSVTDCSNYRWVGVHVVTQGTGSTVNFEASNDSTNWAPCTLTALNFAAALSPSTTGTNVIYHGPLPARYFRVRVSGISAGTTAGVIEFFSVPAAITTPQGIINGPTASGSVASAAPVMVAGSDGTNVRTIKTDTSGQILLGAGTNTIGNVGLNAGSNLVGGVTLTDPGGAAQATVKASSTAPTATDTALVVAVSPNTPALPVTGTFWQSTQPISAAALPLPAGAATAAKQPALGVAGTPSTDVLTVQGAASMTALKVDGSGVTQPVSGTFWQTTQPVSGAVSLTPQTSGGLSSTHLVSAATNNATVVKASAGQVYNIQAFNINATSPRYLKLYNKTTTPAPTTDTSVLIATYLIPANGSGVVVEISNGIQFTTGIGLAVVAGITDADNTSTAASEVIVNIQWK